MLCRCVVILAAILGMAVLVPSGAGAADTRVSAGSPAAPFSQNKQNEPAVTVDANHPNVLVAGANDNIDMEACNAADPTTCPFTPGVGASGVYFSFDRGASWSQPTYRGLTARGCLGPAACVPEVGPIGTLPGYYEAGLVSGGDPAVSFGPAPGPGGTFSWSNGSRLYYANLAANLGAVRSEQAFKGAEAVAVSRIDAPASTGLTSAIVADQANWKTPVIVSRQNAALFSDKEQVWADNASSSPFFGRVYLCNIAFRSKSQGSAAPAPMMVATSTDGGDTWTQRQVTPSATNNQQGSLQGCTVRTDSHGVVYVLVTEFGVGFPGVGTHVLVKSYDGGTSWTKPRALFTIVDTCNAFDAVIGRCVEDGIAGARSDLSAGPSLDIANGAPTGASATDELVDTWVDGRDGLNSEHVLLRTSTDGGAGWSRAAQIEQPGDRGYYSAAALSPTGSDLYVVYNAFTIPYRADTTSSRGLVGVVAHADVAAGGTPGPFAAVHRGVTGDPRGSSQNNLAAEFLGDYVYAAATRSYAAAVWNDVRNAADCPAIDAYHAAQRGGPPAPRPAPQSDCPANFGNSDIYGGGFSDPTP